jgi:hypothetical protein
MTWTWKAKLKTGMKRMRWTAALTDVRNNLSGDYA